MLQAVHYFLNMKIFLKFHNNFIIIFEDENEIKNERASVFENNKNSRSHFCWKIKYHD